MTAAASDTAAVRSRRLELDAWGIVFCGGASRRMGRDKALLPLAGSTLIDRAVAALAGATAGVVLASGSAPRHAELGLECVLDSTQGAGPLAGLAAALARVEELGATYACAVACDMPRVDSALFRRLLELARVADADVCLVANDGGIEPLCAVYHVRTRRAVEAALGRGERRLDSFHPGLRIAAVSEAHLGAGCARNLNTPEEYEAEGGRLA